MAKGGGSLCTFIAVAGFSSDILPRIYPSENDRSGKLIEAVGMGSSLAWSGCSFSAIY
jgi:hypothetical protein